MPWSITRKGTVAIVRMDSNKLNVMGYEFLDEFEATLDKLDTEYKDCSVVLTGNARTFSAGLDLPLLVSAGTGDDALRAKVGQYIERVEALGYRLFTLPRPTVAAINGHAIAGGMLLAAACDYRVADAGVAEASKIGLNEVLNGFSIPYRLQTICAFACNERAAYRQFTSGRLVSLKQAADPAFGFVDELVPAAASSPASAAPSADAWVESPLVQRAAQLVSMKPSSFGAFASVKAVLQERVRAAFAAKPDETQRILAAMYARPASKL